MSARTTCCRSAPKFARCWSGKFLPACPVSPACWGQEGRISSAPARVSIKQCSLMQRIYITGAPQQYKLFNVSCRAGLLPIICLQVANMLCGRAQRWLRCTVADRPSRPSSTAAHPISVNTHTSCRNRHVYPCDGCDRCWRW